MPSKSQFLRRCLVAVFIVGTAISSAPIYAAVHDGAASAHHERVVNRETKGDLLRVAHYMQTSESMAADRTARSDISPFIWDSREPLATTGTMLATARTGAGVSTG